MTPKSHTFPLSSTLPHIVHTERNLCVSCYVCAFWVFSLFCCFLDLSCRLSVPLACSSTWLLDLCLFLFLYLFDLSPVFDRYQLSSASKLVHNIFATALRHKTNWKKWEQQSRKCRSSTIRECSLLMSKAIK